VEKQFRVPLEGTSTHRIAVGHTIRIVDVTPEVSWGGWCCHKNFLLLMVGPF